MKWVQAPSSIPGTYLAVLRSSHTGFVALGYYTVRKNDTEKSVCRMGCFFGSVPVLLSSDDIIYSTTEPIEEQALNALQSLPSWSGMPRVAERIREDLRLLS